MPVVLVAHELEAVVVLPAHELERPGADRRAIDVAALVLDRFRRHDQPDAVRQDGRQARIRPVELERDLALAGDLDAFDRADVGFHIGARVVLVAIEVEFHRLGVEGRAVMKFHAIDEIEHQRLRIGERPGLRKPGLELQRLRHEIDQRVEHRIERIEVRQVAARHRVERSRIVGHRQPQPAALARALLGQCRRGQRERAGAGDRALDQLTTVEPHGRVRILHDVVLHDVLPTSADALLRRVVAPGRRQLPDR